MSEDAIGTHDDRGGDDDDDDDGDAKSADHSDPRWKSHLLVPDGSEQKHSEQKS